MMIVTMQVNGSSGGNTWAEWERDLDEMSSEDETEQDEDDV